MSFALAILIVFVVLLAISQIPLYRRNRDASLHLSHLPDRERLPR